MSASLKALTLVNAAQRAWYLYGGTRDLHLCQTEEEREERKRVGRVAIDAEQALLEHIEDVECEARVHRLPAAETSGVREIVPLAPTTRLSTIAAERAERDARHAAAPTPEAKAS